MVTEKNAALEVSFYMTCNSHETPTYINDTNNRSQNVTIMGQLALKWKKRPKATPSLHKPERTLERLTKNLDHASFVIKDVMSGTFILKITKLKTY